VQNAISRVHVLHGCDQIVSKYSQRDYRGDEELSSL